VVYRHNVTNNQIDTLGTLSVGNGKFAFSADITGLQTFPEFYNNGIPLGTQSEWGWHSFPNSNGYKFEETLKEYQLYDKKVSFPVQIKEPQHAKEAVDYFRSNPHRLHLGIIGFDIRKPDGTVIKPSDITAIHQELDIWKGEIHSFFKVLDETIEVFTICHPDKDLVAFRVKSKLIEKGLLKVILRFPFPTAAHTDGAMNWNTPEKHKSSLTRISPNQVEIERKIDTTRYFTKVKWIGKIQVSEKKAHHFEFAAVSNTIEMAVCFSPEKNKTLPDFKETQTKNAAKWENFWKSGGVIDFSGSTDPRAKELERRIVLSQYLTAIQCAGNFPPQETGLTFNSWFGKFHLEMVWWHCVHFALWNRIELMEKSLEWYNSAAKKAKSIAQRQGYEGIRWQKMTDNTGEEAPSSVGSFLIWQQPHFIYLAELCYRHHKDEATLNKYKDLLFATADFMASYAHYDAKTDRYILGPGLIPAQECYNAQTTINPPYELAYWYWGLKTACQWADRLKLPHRPEWDKVLAKLSKPAIGGDIYLPAESEPLGYENKTHIHDHPAVFGALGMLPESPFADKKIMNNTYDYILKNWKWEETWGWDFPMTAMTATRLGRPDAAIDALLMPITTNTYLSNGHNYQDKRLRLYLPGNGGLLTAIAMMCAGYEGSEKPNPGIPTDGKWKVRWENLQKMP
jgi:hypothetical protein